jgi:hypothetical protein
MTKKQHINCKHIVDLKDAIKYLNEDHIRIAESCGKGSSKKLHARIVMIGNDTEVFYDVIYQGVCMDTINSLPIALEKYNNLP